MTLKRGLRNIALSATALVVCGGAYLGVEHLTGNIHQVVAGELYRSGTLSAGSLETLVKSEGIKTIINLRGEHPDRDWWRAESAIAEANGIELVNFSWSASKELDDEEIASYFETLDEARTPILIHCMSGSDRSGLAAALYLAHRHHADEETAEGQLSIVYGHFGLPFFPAAPMDATFERLEPSLGYHDS
ncbi:tyrosine-protein phosphatase [Jiella marina]|uniref:tyrosine-protein phosphatase n=1 Tax=Jiella sp. LLJ827 TaxID=2917712 RepID=UPI002100AAC5|nr:tyrosine-protein phosphatase [Jiella sp. LLJ827]MCQ0987878.1 tyrosine-protein phosphatase [Jiella sp. LLJ827]